MIFAAPILCQTFKGILPSELVIKYSEDGGSSALEFDLEIALEIQKQREAAMGKVADKDKARGVVSRRNQRRASSSASKETISGSQLFDVLKAEGFVQEGE